LEAAVARTRASIWTDLKVTSLVVSAMLSVLRVRPWRGSGRGCSVGRC
jgi:hypothetical protein